MATRVIIPLSIETGGEKTEILLTQYVQGTYLKLLLHYDLIPVIVSPLMPASIIQELSADAGGLLLCGGNDIDPSLYGEPRHQQTETATIERDHLEIDLIRSFEVAGKAVLGICRGCQMLAVASGGKLIQHIPDLNINESHSSEEASSYARIGHAPLHQVQLDNSSQVARILGCQEININSAHHQAIREVGNWLKIVGRTRGGIVEVIEHVDPQKFVVGIQGHPELEPEGVMAKVFQAFADRSKSINTRGS